MACFAVCSDTAVTKRKRDPDDTTDLNLHDLAYKATTNGKQLAQQFAQAQRLGKPFKVVFSTYQSLQAIHEAQKLGLPAFDLIICDEAHRTTGVKLSKQDESHFRKIHNNNYI
jgi:predicted helicase